MTSLSEALQSTIHRIQSMAAAPIATPSNVSPSPANAVPKYFAQPGHGAHTGGFGGRHGGGGAGSSQWSNSVFGNKYGDVHKLASPTPSVIITDGDGENMDSIEMHTGGGGGPNNKRRGMIIGLIIVVVMVLIVVGVFIYLQRRNSKRKAAEEEQLKLEAEKHTKALQNMYDENEDDDENNEDEDDEDYTPGKYSQNTVFDSVDNDVASAIKNQNAQKQTTTQAPAAQVQAQAQQAQAQSQAKATLAQAQAQAQAQARAIAQTQAQALAQAQAQVQAQRERAQTQAQTLAQAQAQAEKTPQPVAALFAVHSSSAALSPKKVHTFEIVEDDEEAKDEARADSRAVQLYLDGAIVNVEKAITSVLQESIAVDNAFATQSHKHEENVLENHGEPNLSATSRETMLLSPDVLNEPTDSHPLQEQPVNGNINMDVHIN